MINDLGLASEFHSELKLFLKIEMCGGTSDTTPLKG